MARLRGTDAERFWARVQKTDGCWLWTGPRGTRGYGQAWGFGRRHPAHRLSLLLHGVKVPDGMYVCHHCDNPPCVRPDHLFVGTHQDNMKDSGKKGRHWLQKHPELSHLHKMPHDLARGELQGNSRLTEHDIRTIRQLAREGLTAPEIGRQFNVHSGHVRKIVSGLAWAHVSGAVSYSQERRVSDGRRAGMLSGIARRAALASPSAGRE